MKHFTFDHSIAKRLDMQVKAWEIIEDECKKIVEAKRKSYPITSQRFSPEPEELEAFFAKHTLRRG